MLELKKPAELGSVEWVATVWNNVELAVEHVDVMTSREWSNRAMSIHYEEKRRLEAMPEPRPPATEERRNATFALLDDVLSAVAGLRIDGNTMEQGNARKLLARVSYAEADALIGAVLEVQQISTFRASPTQDAGCVESV